MNSFTPGIIIAILLMFLVGILVGYSLVQKRLRKQTEALKVSQRRLTEIEQSHELRLREATGQLRHDYESQLATTIEHYQDQLSQKTLEMEQTYETRFRVLRQGGAPVTAQSGAYDYVDMATRPKPDESSAVKQLPNANVDMVAAPQSPPQRELKHLKQQYEMRLNEAAQKLQKSYETQLAEQTNAAKAELQTAYDQQLASKYQEFEQEFAERQADLERQIVTLQSSAVVETSTLASEITLPTPSEIMGTGDETTVSLMASEMPAGGLSPVPSLHYTQSDLEQQVEAARHEAQAEFDQRLTEQLAAQRVQFDQQLRDLEERYQERLADVSQETAESTITPFPINDLLGDDDSLDLGTDLSEAIAAPPPSEPEAAEPLNTEDDVFARPPLTAEPEQEETSADALSSEAAFTVDALDEVDNLAGNTENLSDQLETALANTPETLDEDVLSEALPGETPDPTTTDEEILFDENNDLPGESSAESQLDSLATPEAETADSPGNEGTLVNDINELFGEAEATPPPLPSDTSYPDQATEFDIGDGLFGDDDLAAVLEAPGKEPAPAEADSLNIEADLFGDNDLFADSAPEESISEDALTEAEVDLFGDNDLFADASQADSSPPESGDNGPDNNDDDDDFGPLDLSDIDSLN
ncbi:MAG: OmpH family outer membrane protein [Cyanobacteria bacterium P01_D01_bin.6]